MRLLIAVFVFALVSGGVAAAQQTSTPAPAAPANSPSTAQPAVTYKVAAQTVIFDVVVTGPDGKPVTGLGKDDFSVLEDHKPQTLTYFEPHTAADVAADAIPKLPAMPPGVYINFPAAPTTSAVNVLLLDALNTPMKDQMYVRQAMVRYLKGLPPGTRIAIFTLASRLRMVQGFSSDSSVLLAAIDDKKHRQLAEQSALLNIERDQALIDSQVSDVGRLAPGGQTSQGFANLQQFNADMASFQVDLRVRITLDALADIGRYLAPVPGRKNLIWFSGSFPLNINADPDLADPFMSMRNYSDEVKSTTNLLSAARVAVYPVDARGLMTIPMYDASNSGAKYVGNPGAFSKDLLNFAANTAAEQATMEQIAEETGGRAIYNSNDLKGALASVVANGANYYTLAYTPANNKWDGRFRRIKVQLARSGYRLQYREGYFADGPDDSVNDTASKSEAHFIALMAHGLPDFSQLLYKVHVHAADPQPAAGAEAAGEVKTLKGPATRYVIEYAALTRDLKFQVTPDGLHHGAIRIAAAAFDRDGNELNAISQELELNLRPETYATFQRVGLQYKQELDLPAGEIYLRTGIFEESTGKIGTLEISLPAIEAKAAK
jgi:VWFA-related protein